MLPPSLPPDEPRRLQALQNLCVLDTPSSNADLRAAVLQFLPPGAG